MKKLYLILLIAILAALASVIVRAGPICDYDGDCGAAQTSWCTGATTYAWDYADCCDGYCCNWDSGSSSCSSDGYMYDPDGGNNNAASGTYVYDYINKYCAGAGSCTPTMYPDTCVNSNTLRQYNLNPPGTWLYSYAAPTSSDVTCNPTYGSDTYYCAACTLYRNPYQCTGSPGYCGIGTQVSLGYCPSSNGWYCNGLVREDRRYYCGNTACTYWDYIGSSTCQSYNAATRDCATKLTSDSDGGDYPLVAGVVMDADACTPSACTNTTYTDVCTDATNVREYVGSGATYSTYIKDCTTYQTADYCSSNNRYQNKWGCASAICSDASAAETLVFSTCSSLTSVSANYCSGASYNACTSLQCCNDAGGGAGGCTDPCSGKNSGCIDTNQGQTGRTCTSGADSCAIATDRFCTITSPNDGYCTSGDADWCAPRLGFDQACTNDNQCVSAICKNNKCAACPVGSNCVNTVTQYNQTLGNVPIFIDNKNARVGIGTLYPKTMLDIYGAMSFGPIQAVNISSLGIGRIYFDATSRKFKVSENGDSFKDLLTASSSAMVKLNLTGGDLKVGDQGKGVILRDSTGSGCHRITVNSAGTLVSTQINCNPGSVALTGACSQTSDCEMGSCLTLYNDADVDGYGAGATVGNFCYWSAPSGKSTVNTDCRDSNNQVWPGQTAYFTSNRGDGSYDYNCDTVESKQWAYAANYFGGPYDTSGSCPGPQYYYAQNGKTSISTACGASTGYSCAWTTDVSLTYYMLYYGDPESCGYGWNGNAYPPCQNSNAPSTAIQGCR